MFVGDRVTCVEMFAIREPLVLNYFITWSIIKWAKTSKMFFFSFFDVCLIKIRKRKIDGKNLDCTGDTE